MDPAELFHNCHKEAAHCYLTLCRKVQVALAEGQRVRVDWTDPFEGYDHQVALPGRVTAQIGGV